MNKVSILMWCLLCLVPFDLSAQAREFTSGNRNVLGTAEDLTASLTFADLDADGDMDAVVANGRHWPQLNEVYLNNGSGRFTVGYALGSERATTYAVPVGDLDGDGDLDLVVANDRAENWVYLNDGQGRFEFAWPVGPEVEPNRSAQLHDMDGDGDLDLLVTSRGASNGIFLNRGDGHFGGKHEFGADQSSTIAVAVGDIDGDGDMDLVLANRDGQANETLINDGRLGFEEGQVFGTGSDETRSAALADVNGDGILDIVTANIGEPNGIYFGDGAGGFSPGASFGGSEQSYALAIVDVDGDGDVDIVVANVSGPNALYRNDGTGSGWTESWLGEDAEATYGVAAADLNGDSWPDLGFANSGSLNRLFLNVEARVPATISPVLSPEHGDDWVFEGSGTWEFDDGVLVLREAGSPGGEIRRPAALALLKERSFLNVKLEAEVRSTADPSIERADILLVFGYQSPTRFHYVHLSGVTDDVHNGIFVVADADRRRIDAGDGAPQLSDREWHRVRLIVDAPSGRIEVFVDDAAVAGLVAVDRDVGSGLVGFGSFDDTGKIRSVSLTGTGPGGE